jgi:hypothetical protein
MITENRTQFKVRECRVQMKSIAQNIGHGDLFKSKRRGSHTRESHTRIPPHVLER